ncbi:MAG: hypothetical protein E6Q50_13120 [Lysobacter sp.]|nr:MAG: hypothetical protein E6Q50_13120 [Lysobacter sp.]
MVSLKQSLAFALLAVAAATASPLSAAQIGGPIIGGPGGGGSWLEGWTAIVCRNQTNPWTGQSNVVCNIVVTNTFEQCLGVVGNWTSSGGWVAAGHYCARTTP